MAAHLRTELVLSAMEMALGQRGPEEVIHHSDRGSQYTSIAFGKRCERAGVRPSTGSSCYDNALCESFFATLECELIERERFASHGDLLLHRRLVQPAATSLRLGLPRAADLRKTTSRPACSRKLLTVRENGATPRR